MKQKRSIPLALSLVLALSSLVTIPVPAFAAGASGEQTRVVTKELGSRTEVSPSGTGPYDARTGIVKIQSQQKAIRQYQQRTEVYKQTGFVEETRTRDEVTNEARTGYKTENWTRDEVTNEARTGYKTENRTRDEVTNEARTGYKTENRTRDEVTNETRTAYRTENRTRDEIAYETRTAYRTENRTREEITYVTQPSVTVAEPILPAGSTVLNVSATMTDRGREFAYSVVTYIGPDGFTYVKSDNRTAPVKIVNSDRRAASLIASLPTGSTVLNVSATMTDRGREFAYSIVTYIGPDGFTYVKSDNRTPPVKIVDSDRRAASLIASLPVGSTVLNVSATMTDRGREFAYSIVTYIGPDGFTYVKSDNRTPPVKIVNSDRRAASLIASLPAGSTAPPTPARTVVKPGSVQAVTKTVAYQVSVPYIYTVAVQKTVNYQVQVPYTYTVPVTKTVAYQVQVPYTYTVAVTKTVAYQVQVPYTYTVPVTKTVAYQVQVPYTYTVPVTKTVTYQAAVPQFAWVPNSDWVTKEEVTGTSTIVTGQITVPNTTVQLSPASSGGGASTFLSDSGNGGVVGGSKVRTLMKANNSVASKATSGTTAAVEYQTKLAGVQAQQQAEQATKKLAKAKESKSTDDIKAAQEAVSAAETATNRLSQLADKTKTTKKQESRLNDLTQTLESLRNSLQQVQDKKDNGHDKR